MASAIVTVESIAEYKDAVDAAETLGLEVDSIRPSRHGWESPDYDAVTPRKYHELVKVGRKYLHFEMNDEVVRVAFGDERSDIFDPASLTLRLK